MLKERHLDKAVVSTEVGVCVHEALEIQIQVLKDQVQTLVAVNYIHQPAAQGGTEMGLETKVAARMAWRVCWCRCRHASVPAAAGKGYLEVIAESCFAPVQQLCMIAFSFNQNLAHLPLSAQALRPAYWHLCALRPPIQHRYVLT